MVTFLSSISNACHSLSAVAERLQHTTEHSGTPSPRWPARSGAQHTPSELCRRGRPAIACEQLPQQHVDRGGQAHQATLQWHCPRVFFTFIQQLPHHSCGRPPLSLLPKQTVVTALNNLMWHGGVSPEARLFVSGRPAAGTCRHLSPDRLGTDSPELFAFMKPTMWRFGRFHCNKHTDSVLHLTSKIPKRVRTQSCHSQALPQPITYVAAPILRCSMTSDASCNVPLFETYPNLTT